MKKGNYSGFTLVELIVTIAIVAILTAVSVPNLLSWIPERRLTRAAGELYGNMQFARLTAIKTREDCTVAFPSAGQYTISIPGQTIKTINLSTYKSGITFNPLPASIIFTPRGLSSAGGTADLTNAGNTETYRASIFISGFIRLAKL